MKFLLTHNAFINQNSKKIVKKAFITCYSKIITKSKQKRRISNTVDKGKLNKCRHNCSRKRNISKIIEQDLLQDKRIIFKQQTQLSGLICRNADWKFFETSLVPLGHPHHFSGQNSLLNPDLGSDLVLPRDEATDGDIL